MTSATASQSSPLVTPLPAAKPVTNQPKKISWAEFEARYLTKEDRYKYEWVDGQVIKTLREMNQRQQLILVNLQDFLEKSWHSAQKKGKLLAEVDTFFDGNLRRPDIAYFSAEQIAAIPSGNQVPKFVIEIISKTDQIALVHQKMQDYRKAKVQVVWHVFPELKEIHVYHGDQMTICWGEKICSADPVLPEMQLAAQDVFEIGQ